MKKTAIVLLLSMFLAAPALAGDIEISDQGLKVLRVSDRYVTYAWKVVLYNNTGEARRVTVKFSLIDENEYELEYGYANGTVDAWSNTTITGRGIAERNLFLQMKNTLASVRAR